MQKTMEVSIDDFGTALVEYIGRVELGWSFCPYIIQRSSLKLEGNISVTLLEESIPFVEKKKNQKNIFPDGALFTLSRENLLEALAGWIATSKLKAGPVKKISKTFPDFPNEIKVMFKYLPKGTFQGEVKHNFDGSL